MNRILLSSILIYAFPILGAVSSTNFMVEIARGNRRAIEHYIKNGGKLDIRVTENEDTLLHIAIRTLMRWQDNYEKISYSFLGISIAGLTISCFNQRVIPLLISGLGLGIYFIFRELSNTTFEQYLAFTQYLIEQLPASVVHAKNKARPAQTSLSLVQSAAFKYSYDQRFVTIMSRLEKSIQEKR